MACPCTCSAEDTYLGASDECVILVGEDADGQASAVQG